MAWRTSFGCYEPVILVFLTGSHYVKGLDFLTALGTYLEWRCPEIVTHDALLSWIHLAGLSPDGAWRLTVVTRCQCMPVFHFCNNSTQLRNIHCFSIMTQNAMLFKNFRDDFVVFGIYTVSQMDILVPKEFFKWIQDKFHENFLKSPEKHSKRK